VRGGSILCSAALAALAVAHPGRAINVDPAGRVYFIDTIRNRLWRVERDGRLTLIKDGVHSDALILGSAGELYAAHDYYDGTAFRTRWWRVTASGTVTPALAGEVPAHDARPKDVDAQGNRYEADDAHHLVRRIAPRGEVTTVLRLRWPWYPTGVAVGPAGAVYVLERNGDYHGFWGAVNSLRPIAQLTGNPRIQVITPDGKTRSLVTLGHPGLGLLLAAALATMPTLGYIRWWRRRRAQA